MYRFHLNSCVKCDFIMSLSSFSWSLFVLSRSPQPGGASVWPRISVSFAVTFWQFQKQQNHNWSSFPVLSLCTKFHLKRNRLAKTPLVPSFSDCFSFFCVSFFIDYMCMTINVCFSACLGAQTSDFFATSFGVTSKQHRAWHWSHRITFFIFFNAQLWAHACSSFSSIAPCVFLCAFTKRALRNCKHHPVQSCPLSCDGVDRCLFLVQRV